MKSYIISLIQYGIHCGLITAEDSIYIYNAILAVMQLDEAEGESTVDLPLADILTVLTDNAVERGIIDDSITARDLFDTKLMGVLTPLPHEVHRRFTEQYADSPQKATEWYYQFSQDTNYIRRDRITKDLRWKYGELDITINLSKPEKDPHAIAAAKLAPQSGYPKCQLCAENEGYAGRINHPARQNHRTIPVTISGAPWLLQYSPYTYYNEHCIVFNREHTPMRISRATFAKLLDFVRQFPHYFVGSNADLPIVGGSILSHDHFQGGNYEFPMARANVEQKLIFNEYEDVSAGIVNWTMSVIRLSSPNRGRLVNLADKILTTWRNYTDEAAFIFAETNSEQHNTITPIARKRGENYELDLVLRNNITTEEHPLGVYHPHSNLHHVKKENIGLIEVMGLAVLPSRLKTELTILSDAILKGTDIRLDERISKHADWVDGLKAKYNFTAENIDSILKNEIGAVFEQVLRDAGVYKRSSEGRAAFLRFIDSVNGGRP